MKYSLLIGVSFAMIVSGCNNLQNYNKKKVYANDTFLGETKDSGYEKGHKLYSTDGIYVGFVDTDNIVYLGTRDDPNYCGGEYVGICESTGENRCNVPNYVRVTVVNGGALIPPYISFNCGEKL